MNMNNNLHDQLYDIYPLMHIPFWQTGWFYGVCFGAALFVIALLIYFLICYWQRRRLQKPYWVQALDALHANNKKYGSSEYAKKFYTQLIEILKKYLQQRYGYDLMSLTDQEMIDYLATHQFPQDLLIKMREIVENSCMIKFANMQIIQERMKQDSESSIECVQKTIPAQNQ